MENVVDSAESWRREMEEEYRALSKLTATMFPPDERTGWYSSLEPEMREWAEVFTTDRAMWQQDARCTACNRMHGVFQPIGAKADDAQILDILAIFAAETWTRTAQEHIDRCANRRLWHAMIAADPALSRSFANRDRAMREMASVMPGAVEVSPEPTSLSQQ